MPMDSATWQRVKTTCADALERAAGEREAFVLERCGEDVEMRQQVLELLAAHGRADPAFLEQPTGGPLEAVVSSQIGQRFGAWELVEELGAGGMGVVYLARRRETDFEQRAALKVMRLAGDAGLKERFQRERQLLAGLEHPNIAHLLDGGTTDEGAPFFAMEYVEGRPIDRYCDEEGLSTDERLGLFLQVCSAVGYAHRNLVVHRDLKPSNIVVTSDGRPKLLDFGIAKLLAEGPGDAAVTSFQALTPAYASPEQLESGAITTASDVYSLGALLYCLLTGRPPFAAGDRSLLELAREREQSPPRPSTVVDGAAARRLQGDLDSIVLKGLWPEPELRYGSVDALAEDLTRYQAGLPVGARLGTFSYLFGKFVRRHKGAVGAGALIALILVGATLASTRAARIAGAERAKAEAERTKAENERAKAERITGFLQRMISSPDASWFSSGSGAALQIAASQTVPGQIAQPQPQQGIELRRHDEGRRGPARPQFGGQQVWCERRHQVHRAADEQRAHREGKPTTMEERRRHQEPVVGRETPIDRGVGQEPHHPAAVRQRDPLGRARRTGRVGDRERLPFRRDTVQRGCRRSADPGLVFVP